MMKKVLSMVLCFVMVFSLLPVFGMNAAAADSAYTEAPVDYNTSWEHSNAALRAKYAESPLKMQKSLYPNGDGTYDVVIESWATGTVETQVIDEAVPTDFVLILDQSGSMLQTIPAQYEPAGNSWKPSAITGDKYYYYDSASNSYYQVYVKDTPTSGYSSVTNRSAYSYGTSQQNGVPVTQNGNQVYYKDSTGAIYPIYRNTERYVGTLLGTIQLVQSSFYYVDGLGVTHQCGSGTWIQNYVPILGWQYNDWTEISSGDIQNWVTVNNNAHRYGLYYKDASNVEHKLNSTDVSSTNAQFYSDTLYKMGQAKTRQQALKDSVTSFVNTVESKAEADGVNHRIAIVGFASDGTPNGGNWRNTELLTGVDVSRTQGKNYHNSPALQDSDYRNALQDVTTTAGRTDLNNAIEEIAADGGTAAQYGFIMAENILEKRESTTYTNKLGQTADRNTVVVFFTDGEPGVFDYTDQVQYGNDTVKAARAVKQNQWKTKVFAVGIFADGDDQPLTFTKSAANMDQNAVRQQQARNNYINKYEGGYLYFRGNVRDQSTHNDTIKNYMRAVSSDYSEATEFLKHPNGADSVGTSEDSLGINDGGEQYYMRVTDSAGLQRAFEVIAGSIDTSVPPETVGSEAVLEDTLFSNPANGDFDATNATVEVKTVGIETVDGIVRETGNPGVAPVGAPVVSNDSSGNMKIDVSGFDYSKYYTSAAKPDGEKLVVTIKNLVPRKAGHLYSNYNDANIYPTGESMTDKDIVVGVETPEMDIDRVYKVVDYNYPLQLSDSVIDKNIRLDGTVFASGSDEINYKSNNGTGTFKTTDHRSKLTYQLLTESLMGNTTLLDYRGVDSALFFESKSDGNAWKGFELVPANNVYFDDDILNATVTNLNQIEGVGHNGQVTTGADQFAEGTASKIVSYTFTGTGIDVYGTTTTGGSLVTGQIRQGGQVVVINGEKCQMSMLNKSKVERYNVPTIFFHDLPYGTYELRLIVGANSVYQLDGIRVYNPAGEDSAANKIYGTGEKTSNLNEANAVFANFREMMLANGADTGYFTDKGDTDSTAYVKEGEEWVEKTYTAHSKAAYEVDGPKNEVYLDKGTALSFTIENWASFKNQGYKIMVGLSAPNKGHENVSVFLSGNSEVTAITSAMDMYYEIKPDDDGTFAIANTSTAADDLLAVTNLKVTGPSKVEVTLKDLDPDATVLSVEETDALPLILTVNEKTEAYAASINALANGAVFEIPAEDPAEPDVPEETDPVQTLKDMLKQILSDFVNSLFNSISRLFGR